MNEKDFIKADKRMKDNPWHTICFGWILQGMKDNGKSEIENASKANKILNYLIRDVRSEKQTPEDNIEQELKNYRKKKYGDILQQVNKDGTCRLCGMPKEMQDEDHFAEGKHGEEIK